MMDREKLARPGGHPLEIRTGHNPLELALLWATAAGVLPALLFPPARAISVDQVFPTWALLLWYGNLLLWVVVGLCGIVPRPIHQLTGATYKQLRRRLNCERVGVFGTGGTYLSFGFSSMAAQGWHGVGGAFWLLGLAIGLFWRGGQIGVDLHKLTRAREDPPPPARAMGDPDAPC